MKVSDNLAKQFQKKWRILNALEKKEKRRTTFKDRLRDSASLMRLGKALHVSFKEDKEKRAARLRWIRLKKNFYG